MTTVMGWMAKAAIDISRLGEKGRVDSASIIDIIAGYCPFKAGEAYIRLPTPAEQQGWAKRCAEHIVKQHAMKKGHTDLMASTIETFAAAYNRRADAGFNTDQRPSGEQANQSAGDQGSETGEVGAGTADTPASGTAAEKVNNSDV